MAGLSVLLAYLLAGIVCAHVALWDKSPLLRIWIGLCFGMLLLMWLPALMAYIVGFTLLGEWIALALLALLTACAVFRRWKHPKKVKLLDTEDRKMLLALLGFALPMALLSAYLQHTHTLRPVDGALHVGQSTYGDLPMHLSIVTGLRGVKLPTDYIILPGSSLGYPLLIDATGTSLMLFGLSARWAILLPGIVMSALVYAGFLLLAHEMTGHVSTALLAGALLFFNGGLGFLYSFDLSGSNFSKITEIFTGFYKTPANQPDLNLRWSNLVVDLLLPQRTFLGGWTLLLPALYFVREAFQKGEMRMFLLCALFAGALPQVHTHSFVALALFSAGALVYSWLSMPVRRRALCKGAGVYLVIVLLLALPQFITSTLQQVTNEGFLRLHFNWVNHSEQGFTDFYPWFWLKNVGLPLIVMLCALLDFKKRNRMDMIGASLIFLVAELVLFQPLDYDNNKLFYIWYLLMLPPAVSWCLSFWRRLRGHRSRVFLAAVFLTASMLSGALSIAREVVSDYQLFGPSEVKAGLYIDENTNPDAILLTGQQHNNPVYALAGRKVVCGPPLYLYWHGLAYAQREADVAAFYKDPAENLALLKEYDVTYIALGWSERYELKPDEDALDALFEVVYDVDGYKLYDATSFLSGD